MNKVSILTPCYNSSDYIYRLLDSVLQQTYSNIEMFVINDGSTDNSEEVITSYLPKFEKKGYTLKCINQTNQGQGSAVNNGLKYITGEYLLWPDSDDFYAYPTAIEKMVNVLEKNKVYGTVRTFAHVLEGVSLKIIDEFGGKKYKKNKTNIFFEDCLFGQNNFWFGAGMYMIRTSLLFQNYPDRNYYISNKFGGQNWQLLLPLLYKKECYTLEEHLFKVLDRKESHSRGTYTTISDQVKKYEEHRKILINTLDYIIDMPIEERQEYQRLIYIKYEKLLINLIAKKYKKEAIKRLISSRTKYGVRLTFKESLIFCYNFISIK